MNEEMLSAVETLKFARHDYLNELQLILMHIDLGNLPDAKQALLNATEKLKESSKLGILGLPVIEHWLTTFQWKYTAFQTSVTSAIEPGHREADEEKIVSYLNNVFVSIGEKLNPLEEYQATIDVQAAHANWTIRITIHGKMEPLPQLSKEHEGFFVEEEVSSHLWTMTIRGQ